MPGGARRRANLQLRQGGQPHSKPRKPRGCCRRFPIQRLSKSARPDAENTGQARRDLAGDQYLGVRDGSLAYGHSPEASSDPMQPGTGRVSPHRSAGLWEVWSPRMPRQ